MVNRIAAKEVNRIAQITVNHTQRRAVNRIWIYVLSAILCVCINYKQTKKTKIIITYKKLRKPRKFGKNQDNY